MDKSSLHAFLSQHCYAVISSISATGHPQSALVGIAVTQKLEVIFDTLKSSRKYANLIAHPTCSLVIGWSNEKTLQLEGEAFEPSVSDRDLYQQIYLNAWPDGRARSTSPNLAYIVVRPRWIRYSDYAASPPVIEELSL